MGPPGRRAARVGRWAGPVVIVLAGTAMARWSWLTWPDVLIDFGRELYVAWQLAEGKALYTDIAYFNGPLSAYLNAAWFRLFGVGLHTLANCNIAILAGLVWLLYRLLSDISDHFSATAACLVFVTIFAFSQVDAIGNYNYVCPYSHEMTHGLFLCLLAVFFLFRYQRCGRLRCIAAAGVATGLLFLTKAEVFAAATAAVVVGLSLTLWLERPGGRRVLAVLGSFGGAALVPVAAAFGLLCVVLPAGEALKGTFGAWPAALNSQVASLRFYRWGMGTLDVGESVRSVLTWTAWYGMVFVPAGGLALALRKPGVHRPAVAAGLFALLVVVLGRYWEGIAWHEALLPLPLFMFVLSGTWLVLFFRRRSDPQRAAALIRRLTLCLLALALLGKIILNARLFHYGFALAMPATMVLVVAVVSWVPAWIGELRGYGHVFRAAGLAAAVVTVFALLQVSKEWFELKWRIVSSGADAFRADMRADFVNATLERIATLVRPDETLAVLPEGVMLNYLSRRVNPTPYINFMPPELLIFGERSILDSLKTHPPDFIVLVHKDTSEYGFKFFGRDYGQQIYAWIAANYRGVSLVGSPPLQDDRPGLLLMQRVRQEVE